MNFSLVPEFCPSPGFSSYSPVSFLPLYLLLLLSLRSFLWYFLVSFTIEKLKWPRAQVLDLFSILLTLFEDLPHWPVFKCYLNVVTHKFIFQTQSSPWKLDLSSQRLFDKLTWISYRPSSSSSSHIFSISINGNNFFWVSQAKRWAFILDLNLSLKSNT